jgi:hypothetical protein
MDLFLLLVVFNINFGSFALMLWQPALNLHDLSLPKVLDWVNTKIQNQS